MARKSKRKAAELRSEPSRSQPVHAGRRPGLGRRLLVPFAGLVVAAVVTIVAFVALGARDRAPDGEPAAWATLNTADVHALAFAPDDPEHLYFGHHDGLLETRDGGRTWQPASLTDADAMTVRLAGEGRIQIAGHELYVESTDGGATWQPVPNDLPGLDLHAFAVDPADADHAWTFAVGFGLFETRDGGRHWELRQPGGCGHLATYRDGETTTLLAVGPPGLARSLDGGASWQPLAYPGAPLAGGLAAASDGSLLYAATTFGLRRSADHGQTWQETAFGGVALALAVAPGDPMAVAVVDDATRFYRSRDGGTTWPPP